MLPFLFLLDIILAISFYEISRVTSIAYSFLFILYDIQAAHEAEKYSPLFSAQFPIFANLTL